MAEKVRWGILSTANIGRKRVIPAIVRSRNGVVTAIASRDRSRAETLAAEFDVATAFDSYEALIESSEVDAVYNPLPNSHHAAWALRAAEAGKPMLCEKPLAVDAAEAQRMVDAFAAAGVLFAEAFMYRFHPQTLHVKAMLDTGEIGELRSINASFVFSLRNPDNIRLSAALAGGSLMDVGCYCINVMRLFTGEEPAAVSGVQTVGETGVDTGFSGVLAFPSGVLGHFASGLSHFRGHSYTITGSTGRIRVDEAFVPEPGAETVIHHWRDDRHSTISIPGADHYQLMVEDFADALIEARPPRYTPEDAVANMRVIDRLKRDVVSS